MTKQGATSRSARRSGAHSELDNYLSNDDYSRIEELRAGGVRWGDIADEYGMTADTIRKRCRKFKLATKGKGAPVKDTDVRRMEASARQHAPSAMPTDRPPVMQLGGEDYDAESLDAEWERAAKLNERRIKRTLERSRVRATFSSDPVGVVFVSDQHIAVDNCVDLCRMREDAELVAETPGLYACLGGDGVDNHIKHRAAILAGRSQPQEQYHLYEFYLQILATKILAVITGNHELWTDQIAGVDVVSWICRNNRLCYCRTESHVGIELTGIDYTCSFRHKYRFNSSMNMTHSVKQWFRFGEVAWDFAALCHHHEPAIECCMLHGRERWVCRTGSYQIVSAYSMEGGYNRSRPTCPTVVIYPHERHMVGFNNVRDAAKWMRMEMGR